MEYCVIDKYQSVCINIVHAFYSKQHVINSSFVKNRKQSSNHNTNQQQSKPGVY